MFDLFFMLFFVFLLFGCFTILTSNNEEYKKIEKWGVVPLIIACMCLIISLL